MLSTSLAEGIGRLKKTGQIRIRNSDGSIQYEERSEDGTLVIKSAATINGFHENSIYFDLVHTNQTATWDCGLTCLSMIYSYDGIATYYFLIV
jgi:hypothetical protein